MIKDQETILEICSVMVVSYSVHQEEGTRPLQVASTLGKGTERKRSAAPSG